MNSIYNLEQYNITIIFFDEIFKNIQLQFLNNISKLNNNSLEFNNENKRIFQHFLIYEICKYFSSCKLKNKILYIQPSFIDYNFEILKYFNKTIIYDFTINTFNNIKNYIPFPIFISTINIDFNSKSGEVIDILNAITEKQHSFDIKDKQIFKLKKFTKKNGLLYLTNNFLLSNNFKKLLFNS